MSQTEAPTDDVGQRRRYRWLFGFEWILLVLTVAGFTLIPKVPADWPRIALGYVLVFLCMWHIVVIPICFFYLIGNPIVIVSPSRKFRKQLEQRPKLNDDEFYARFYEGSGIPRKYRPAFGVVCRTFTPWSIGLSRRIWFGNSRTNSIMRECCFGLGTNSVFTSQRPTTQAWTGHSVI